VSNRLFSSIKELPLINQRESQKVLNLIQRTERERGFNTEDKFQEVVEKFQNLGIINFRKSEHGSPEDHLWDFLVVIKKIYFFSPLSNKQSKNKTITVCIQLKSSETGVLKFWEEIVKKEREWIPVLKISPEKTFKEIEKGFCLLIRKVLDVYWKKNKTSPPVVFVDEKGVRLVKIKKEERKWVVV